MRGSGVRVPPAAPSPLFAESEAAGGFAGLKRHLVPPACVGSPRLPPERTQSDGGPNYPTVLNQAALDRDRLIDGGICSRATKHAPCRCTLVGVFQAGVHGQFTRSRQWCCSRTEYPRRRRRTGMLALRLRAGHRIALPRMPGSPATPFGSDAFRRNSRRPSTLYHLVLG
ncbi:MAG: hypothetical protein K0S81_3756 [Rhodospirillales bacterium]|nr:hypothetical protein [Rhodospirillales bacterium]